MSTPLTDAYLERMARRDDPNDYGVCRHNHEATTMGRPCPDCRTTPPVIEKRTTYPVVAVTEEMLVDRPNLVEQIQSGRFRGR